VILDTNFIITCAKQKIDFFKEIVEMGLEIVIPEQVIQELKSVSKDREKKKESREAAKLSLRILEKAEYTPLLLEGSYVDLELIESALENPEIIIATLDREVKKKLKKKNKQLVIRGKKRLEII